MKTSQIFLLSATGVAPYFGLTGILIGLACAVISVVISLTEKS